MEPPRTQIAQTLAPKYLYWDYFKAKVYTIWVLPRHTGRASERERERACIHVYTHAYVLTYIYTDIHVHPLHPKPYALHIYISLLLPIVSIVVPFWGYLIGSLIYNWLNQRKELQWRP